MISKVVRSEIYKGLVLKAFWFKPSSPEAKLSYGYTVHEGDSSTEGLGFRNSVVALEAAEKAADGMLDVVPPAKGRYKVKHA
jgi:hypothetical protein